MRDKAPLVARKLAHWHKVHLPGKCESLLFPTLWKWLNGIPSPYSVPDIQHRFARSIDVAYVREQLVRLEKRIEALNCPVVFCHNDLLSANIIYQNKKDDVAFIDFEYGGYNHRSFDIANHFCEWAGFECDYSLYPNEEEQRAWLAEYIKSHHCGSDPCSCSVDKLLKEVSVFALCSHLYWGLWGLVQASFSDIPFDYMGYAIKRLSRFRETQHHNTT